MRSAGRLSVGRRSIAWLLLLLHVCAVVPVIIKRNERRKTMCSYQYKNPLRSLIGYSSLKCQLFVCVLFISFTCIHTLHLHLSNAATAMEIRITCDAAAAQPWLVRSIVRSIDSKRGGSPICFITYRARHHHHGGLRWRRGRQQHAGGELGDANDARHLVRVCVRVLSYCDKRLHRLAD